jgi:hypothetical protein
MIQITIGRFGEKAKKVGVPQGTTIGALLKKAEIKLSRSEKIWIGGNKTKSTQKIQKGDIINIVGSRAGGTN